MWDGDSEVPGQHSACVYRGARAIKVFKDKGGDRKQRQDQTKAEKLCSNEQVGVASLFVVPSHLWLL